MDMVEKLQEMIVRLEDKLAKSLRLGRVVLKQRDEARARIEEAEKSHRDALARLARKGYALINDDLSKESVIRWTLEAGDPPEVDELEDVRGE